MQTQHHLIHGPALKLPRRHAGLDDRRRPSMKGPVQFQKVVAPGGIRTLLEVDALAVLHHIAVLAMGNVVAQRPLHRVSQLFQRAVAGHLLAEHGQQTAIEAHHETEQQFVLARKVLVDGALAHLRPLRDLLHRHRLPTRRRAQLQRRGQDVLFTALKLPLLAILQGHGRIRL